MGGDQLTKWFPLLTTCPLFADIKESDLPSLLKCLSVYIRQVDKQDFVFMAGEKVTTVGIVLSGSVHVIMEDYWGNRAILAHVPSGHLFAESFSCAEVERLPVSVVAAEKSELLMMDYRKIITTCGSACVFHTQLIRNMLRIQAEKNIQLTRKMEHLTKRTTREKLLSYLSAEAQQAGRSSFTIPFDRQGLADYLAVDRSAMSNELSKLQKEGLIRFHKNRFELL